MEREIMRGPLSPNAGFRLFVTGAIGSDEIAKIIRMLELQKEFFQESETVTVAKTEG